MYTSLYLEVNAICIIIILFILYKVTQNVDKQIDNIAFVHVNVSTLALLIFDIIWVLVDNRMTASSYKINTVINCLYLFQTGVISYNWVLFVEYKINKQNAIKKTVKLLIILPLLFLFVTAVATPWTKWLFYIDENNVYHRGTFHFLQMVIAYGYLFVAAIHPLIKLTEERNRIKRTEYLILALFLVFPVIGGTLQAVFFGLPTTGAGAALSLLLFYIKFQEQQIFTDSLIGLNNRRQLDKHLQSKISEAHRRKSCFSY